MTLLSLPGVLAALLGALFPAGNDRAEPRAAAVQLFGKTVCVGAVPGTVRCDVRVSVSPTAVRPGERTFLLLGETIAIEVPGAAAPAPAAAAAAPIPANSLVRFLERFEAALWPSATGRAPTSRP